MSALTTAQAEEVARLRQVARRSLAQGRRWYLRAVLLMVIAVVGGSRGGSLYTTIAIVMIVLATMAISLGHSLRKQGRIMADRIDLMEHMSSEELGELRG